MKFLILFLTLFLNLAFAEDQVDTPKNREEMKLFLEELKYRKSRLPLPINSGTINNALSRKIYLPESWYLADFKNDPEMTLSYELKTQCFWVVSKLNNCYYCLGHQEHKLNILGFSDEEISFLDYDWLKLNLKTQKAINFSKKLTLFPNEINDQDIRSLNPEFNDKEIIELVYTISMFNSVNRWTSSLGLPQDFFMKEKPINFLTPTNEEIKNKNCLCDIKEKKDRVLPPIENVLKKKERKCRVNLISIEEAKAILDINVVQDWERILATFPDVGKKQYNCYKSLYKDGHISDKIKYLISWTTARSNNAFVSLNKSFFNLSNLGLDPLNLKLTESELEVTNFTKKLTEDPQYITDKDIDNLKRFYENKEVAEIIYFICFCNMFDRITESLNCDYKYSLD